MAELHESLLVSYRKSAGREGFQEAKNPMPTFRPDYFGQRTKRSQVLEEVVVEAEIPSTIFLEHTTEQLLKMQEYIDHQKRKKIKVSGFLLIPKGKTNLMHAQNLLNTFVDFSIKVIQY